MTNHSAHHSTYPTIPPSAWFKSSYSGQNGGNCIEVAIRPTAVHVRDSKDPQGGTLAFNAENWAAFTAFAASCSEDSGATNG